jgi:hypothetical protein
MMAVRFGSVIEITEIVSRFPCRIADCLLAKKRTMRHVCYTMGRRVGWNGLRDVHRPDRNKVGLAPLSVASSRSKQIHESTLQSDKHCMFVVASLFDLFQPTQLAKQINWEAGTISSCVELRPMC